MLILSTSFIAACTRSISDMKSPPRPGLFVSSSHALPHLAEAKNKPADKKFLWVLRNKEFNSF